MGAFWFQVVWKKKRRQEQENPESSGEGTDLFETSKRADKKGNNNIRIANTT